MRKNMSSPARSTMWNDDLKKAYWQDKKVDQERAEAKHSGKVIADNIDQVMIGLNTDESNLIEFMVLSNVRKIIAQHEVDVLGRLVSKKLLRLRPGVGTIFMQGYQTSFSIPETIWETLLERSDTIFNSEGKSVEDRLCELTIKLGDELNDIIPIS
jgi:hypothetical protein